MNWSLDTVCGEQPAGVTVLGLVLNFDNMIALVGSWGILAGILFLVIALVKAGGALVWGSVDQHLSHSFREVFKFAPAPGEPGASCQAEKAITSTAAEYGRQPAPFYGP